MSAEFKRELAARCQEQARWFEIQTAAAIEPGAYLPAIRDELIATYEERLRNIEGHVSTLREAQPSED